MLALDSLEAVSHNSTMPTRSSKDHDFITVARSVVEQAIGEHLDGTPLENPDAGKNPHAVALGKLGGEKGGRARAKNLSAKRRKQIAKMAASARWSEK
jgi:hypothetical protein